MRELKFRAKDLATKEQWEPKPYKEMLYFNMYDVPKVLGYTFCEDDKQWKRRFIVMEYTGLDDIHGIPIYEGDIVVHKTSVFGVPVEFTLGAFRISSHTLLNRIESCEVIGNIYEGVDGEPWDN
jgi:hypothetical protein